MGDTEKHRLALFLYLESAGLDDDTREKMIEAGYLPVKVNSLTNYRIIEHPREWPRAETAKKP